MFYLFKMFGMCLLFWLALASWSISLLVGVSPDEDFHQTMIYCASSNNHERCNENGKRVGHCYSMQPMVAASCSIDKTLVFPRATLASWSTYPTLYYKSVKIFIGNSLGETTRNIRLFNLSLALLLAIGSVSLSHPLLRRPVAISWVVSSVPLGIFFISSINPSAWAIISVAALWGPLLTLFCGSQQPFLTINSNPSVSVIRVLFIAVVLGIGLGSRTEPYVLIPLVFIATSLYWAMGSKNIWKSIIRGSIALFLISLIAIFIILLVDQTHLKMNQLFNHSFSMTFKQYFLGANWKTFYLSANTLLGMVSINGIPGSEIGTHDVPTPAIASFMISMTTSGSILLGLIWIDKKKAVSLLFLIGAIFFIVSFFWSSATWDIYQSRYFLPILYPILGFALIPSSNVAPIFNKLQWIIILISLALANSLMLLTSELRFLYGVIFQVSRYPLNKESPAINPTKLFASEVPNWWLGPDFISPFMLWIIGSLSFLMALLLLFQWITAPSTKSNSAHIYPIRNDN